MALKLVQSLSDVNIFGKLAFIFLLLAMFFGWIAYTTANWCRTYPTENDDAYYGYGVWRRADNSEPFSGSIITNDGWLLPWFGAFQAFATFGFISLNVGFLLVVLLIFVESCKNTQDLGFWNAVNCLIGCGCWLIAIILFGAKFKSFDPQHEFNEPHVSHSFIFAVFTLALQLVAGIVLLLVNGQAKVGSSSSGGGGGGGGGSQGASSSKGQHSKGKHTK